MFLASDKQQAGAARACDDAFNRHREPGPVLGTPCGPLASFLPKCFNAADN
jgi:hypothetical protein